MNNLSVLKYSDRYVLNHFYAIMPYVTAFVNISMIALIYFKSAKSMQKFKYYLIYLRFTVWSFEIVTTVVLRSHLLLPLLLAQLEGPYVEFLGGTVAYCLLAIALGTMTASYIFCFIYRNQTVHAVHSGKIASFRTYVFLALFIHIYFAVPPTILYFVSSTPREEIATLLKSRYINAMDILNKFPHLILIWNIERFWSNVYMLYLFVETMVAAVAGLVININTFVYLKRIRHIISASAQSAHYNALKILLLEICVPGLFIFIPVILAYSANIFNVSYDFTTLSDILLILASMHSILDNFIVFASVRDYRTAVYSWVQLIISVFNVRKNRTEAGLFYRVLLKLRMSNASEKLFTLQYSDRVVVNIVYTILSVLSATLDISVIYLIIFKSIESMAQFRFYLVFMRAATWTFEFSWVLVCNARFMLPLPMVEFKGPMANLLGATNCYAIACVAISIMGSSYFMCFNYRNQAVKQGESILKRGIIANSIIFSIFFTVSMIVCSCIYYASEPRNRIEVLVKSKIANAVQVLHDHPVLLYFDYEGNIWAKVYIGMFAGFTSLTAVCGTILNVNTYKCLSAMKNIMSANTLKAHYSACRSLLLQVCIPLSTIGIPVLFSCGSIVFNHPFSPILIDLNMIMLSMQSILDSIVLISTIKCYRQALVEMTCRNKLIFRSKNSSGASKDLPGLGTLNGKNATLNNNTPKAVGPIRLAPLTGARRNTVTCLASTGESAAQPGDNTTTTNTDHLKPETEQQ